MEMWRYIDSKIDDETRFDILLKYSDIYREQIIGTKETLEQYCKDYLETKDFLEFEHEHPNFKWFVGWTGTGKIKFFNNRDEVVEECYYCDGFYDKDFVEDEILQLPKVRQAYDEYYETYGYDEMEKYI